MFPASGTVIACVSGGADSMAMLEALLDIAQMRGFDVCAAHFNHMLRGGESSRDEDFVAGYCAGRGVPLRSRSGDAGAHASENRLGIEEAARDLRYGFFCSVAEEIGAGRIATGHTADDNIETVIMNLARGAGAAGLSGIPPVREIRNSEFGIRNCSEPSRNPQVGNTVAGNAQVSMQNKKSEQIIPHSAFRIPNSGAASPRIIRPMLRVSRDEVMRFVSERGIPFVEDSTNGLDIYTRNRIRRKVIPVIREMNPKYAEAASAASGLLRADDEYLSALADEFIENGCAVPVHDTQHSTLNTQHWREAPGVVAAVSATELANLPLAVSGRVIRKLCGGRASHGHVEAALELCRKDDPSARLSLPGMTVYREYGSVVFCGDGGGAERSVECGVWSVELGDAGGAERSVEGFAPVRPKDGDRIKITGAGLELSCNSVECGDILHIINKSVTSFLLKKDEICGIITVRPRRQGDEIRLFGQNGTKSLKKLFIERRIPARKRNLVPVVADDIGALAVYGIGAGDRAVPEPGDEAFQITFETIND